MTLVSSFAELLQPFALAMTNPTFTNFLLLDPDGFSLPKGLSQPFFSQPGSRTPKHHSRFYDVFARAKWTKTQSDFGPLRISSRLSPEPSCWYSTIPWPTSVGSKSSATACTEILGSRVDPRPSRPGVTTGQFLGFEAPQGWSKQSVKLLAPMVMLLYTLVVVW